MAKDPEVGNLLPSVARENPLIKQMAQNTNNSEPGKGAFVVLHMEAYFCTFAVSLKIISKFKN